MNEVLKNLPYDTSETDIKVKNMPRFPIFPRFRMADVLNFFACNCRIRWPATDSPTKFPNPTRDPKWSLASRTTRQHGTNQGFASSVRKGHDESAGHVRPTFLRNDLQQGPLQKRQLRPHSVRIGTNSSHVRHCSSKLRNVSFWISRLFAKHAPRIVYREYDHHPIRPSLARGLGSSEETAVHLVRFLREGGHFQTVSSRHAWPGHCKLLGWQLEVLDADSSRQRSTGFRGFRNRQNWPDNDHGDWCQRRREQIRYDGKNSYQRLLREIA